MKRTLLMILAAGLFAAFSGCDKQVADSTGYTKIPAAEKNANWKAIEDMRKGVTQSTPAQQTIVRRAELATTPSITSKRLLKEEHKQGLDRMHYKNYSDLTPSERNQKDAIDTESEHAKQQAADMDNYYSKMGWKD